MSAKSALFLDIELQYHWHLVLMNHNICKPVMELVLYLATSSNGIL